MYQTDFQNNLYNYYRISCINIKSLFDIYNKNIFYANLLLDNKEHVPIINYITMCHLVHKNVLFKLTNLPLNITIN